MRRQCVLILAVTVLLSGTTQAVLPKSGTFDINGPSGLAFAPIPWTSSNPSLCVYLWPFSSDDLYEGSGAQYNLAEVTFSAGSFAVTDDSAKSGNLGVRVGNYAGSTQTFEASILTLDFIGGGSFDVYLPEFTFETGKNMFFWISENGAAYYAHSSKGVGLPDMPAAEAMAAGDEYLVRVPEPATLLLIGLGGILLRRKIKH